MLPGDTFPGFLGLAYSSPLGLGLQDVRSQVDVKGTGFRTVPSKTSSRLPS